ncbi:MAG: cytoplasmic protein [Acidobacteria bacterium]|nr:cytoplasmic protein [Acidobacteriota bacterium]
MKEFYASRLAGLKDLSLKKVLKKKNPCLYRALGIEKASEIVEQIMAAFITSSDETIFGNVFFEPIAKLAAGGRVAPTEGVDFTLEKPDHYLAVAVKSGPSWGNADQHKRQSTNFDSLRRRLYKLNKSFDPLVGQAYGQQSSEPTDNSRFRRRSGQAFWEEITGDQDFYLKLIRLMRDVPGRNRPRFRAEWDQAVNRFTREFMEEFCCPDGSIDWEKLLAFNSAKKSGRVVKGNSADVRH